MRNKGVAGQELTCKMDEVAPFRCDQLLIRYRAEGGRPWVHKVYTFHLLPKQRCLEQWRSRAGASWLLSQKLPTDRKVYEQERTDLLLVLVKSSWIIRSVYEMNRAFFVPNSSVLIICGIKLTCNIRRNQIDKLYSMEFLIDEMGKRNGLLIKCAIFGTLCYLWSIFVTYRFPSLRRRVESNDFH